MQPEMLMCSPPISRGAAVIAEALGDSLRDRDRARRCERAIIEAGAGDDIGHEADIGRREADASSRVAKRRQIVERDMRQDEILLVRDADFAMRVALGEIGRPHPSARP